MANRYYRGPRTDHFDGERFFNPGRSVNRHRRLDMLRWLLRRGPPRAPWPDAVAVTPARPEARVDGLRITGVGHASLLIQAAGRNLLADPVWSTRASPVAWAGPRRVAAPGIAFDDLPPIDAVLLSHCHYDHLDVNTLRRLHARWAPLFVVPLGVDAILRAAVPRARVVVGDWFDRVALADGLATTLTPACHWSNRSPFDVRHSLWCGHFLETAAGTVWFAGDTGWGDGSIFPRIRARLGAPDAALIPIGAFEPRAIMAASHTTPAEAVRIMAEVGAARALGIHWGMFRLSDEAWEAPRAELARACEAAGLAPGRFVAAEPGGVYDLA